MCAAAVPQQDLAPLLACASRLDAYLSTSGLSSALNAGIHVLRPDARLFGALQFRLSDLLGVLTWCKGQEQGAAADREAGSDRV